MDNNFWGILFFCIAAGAVLLLGVLHLIARFMPDEEAEEVRAPSKVAAPQPAPYVPPARSVAADDAPPFSAFERPERPAFVPPVQLLNSPHIGPDDVLRLDTLARLMAAGTVSESAAIVAVYDGRGGVPKVSKGGSAAYVAKRDALRALASAYGWRPAPPAEPAEEPAVTPLAGRPIPRGVKFEAEDAWYRPAPGTEAAG